MWSRAEPRTGRGALLAACLLAPLAAGCPPPTALPRPDRLEGGERTAIRLAAPARTPEERLARGYARLAHGGDLPGGLDDLSRAAEALPHARARAWLVSGVTELGRARFAEASEALLRAAEADPATPEAALAALLLPEPAGELPGGHDLVAPRVRALLPRAPAALAQQLRTCLLLGARRLGQTREAEAEAEALGRVPTWRLALPYGRHGLVDFARPFPPELGPPAKEAGLRLYPAATEDGDLFVEVDEAGVLYAEAYFRLEIAAGLRVCARSPGTYALLVDDRPGLERLAHRAHGPRETCAALDAPAGWHRLLLKTPLRQGRARFQVEVGRLDGRPAKLAWWPARGTPPAYVPGAARPLPGGDGPWSALEAEVEARPDDAIGPWLAGLQAWRRGDLKRARELLRLAEERAGPFPLAAYLDGLILLEDPEVPVGIDALRARERLQAALAQGPALDMARFHLALLDGEQGETERALAALAELDARHPSVRLWPLGRARIQEKLGWGAEAEAGLRQALVRQPHDAEALEGLFTRATQAHALAEATGLAERLAALGLAGQEVADLWLQRGERARAEAWRAAALARDATRPELHLAWIDGLLSRGELEAAEAALREAATALGPGHPATDELTIRRAELLDRRGRTAESLVLRQALSREHPSDVGLRRALAAQQGLDGVRLVGDLRLDARQVIAEFLAEPPLGGSTVVVLDFASVEVAADGTALERVHTLVQLRSPEAVDQWGEIAHIPHGAHVERLRTLSADGGSREAELIPGKDSVSLPGLRVGDFVELAYVQGISGRSPFRRAYLGLPFLFRAANSPLWWSRLSLACPPGTPVSVDAHHGAPAPRRELVDGLEVRVFEARRVPALTPEPHAAPAHEWVPFVQLGFGQGWEDHRALLREELLEATRPSDEIARWARAAAGVEGPGRERLRRLFRKVLDEVRQTEPASAFDLPAASVLAIRQGNRLVLLAAALRALGLSPRVLLARTAGQAQLDRALPAPGVFGAGLIQVVPEGGGPPVWLDPGERFHAFDRLYPSLGGMPALDLGSPESPAAQGFARLPEVPLEGLEKRIELTLELDESGALAGQGREVITTAQAVQYRELLGGLSPAQHRQVLETGLGAFFPGARLESFELEALQDAEAPLGIRYRFRVPRHAVAHAGRLVLRGGFYPYQLVQNLVIPGDRRSPLALDDATSTRTEVRIALPPGARLEPSPDVELAGPMGEFRQRVRQVGAEVRLHKELRVRPGRVPPGDHPAFAEFCRQVDAADTAALVVRLP